MEKESPQPMIMSNVMQFNPTQRNITNHRHDVIVISYPRDSGWKPLLSWIVVAQQTGYEE